jgi:Rod binding domain-containing protein
MVEPIGLPSSDNNLVQFMARPLSGSVGARLQSLAKGGAGADSPEAKLVAAREFASLLLRQLLKQMRKSTRMSESLLDGGHEQRMYEDMLDDHMAREMAQSGQIGLAKTIYENMVRMDVQNDERSADAFLMSKKGET